jgi:hypothetical protein
VAKQLRKPSAAKMRKAAARLKLKLAAIAFVNSRADHLPREKVVDINFTTSLSVARALEALALTGFFGNGRDSASVAEELLRRALLQPGIVEHWRKS